MVVCNSITALSFIRVSVLALGVWNYCQQICLVFPLFMPDLAHLMYMCRLVHILNVYMLYCFALFVCLTLLASFFLPSHLSFAYTC